MGPSMELKGDYLMLGQRYGKPWAVMCLVAWDCAQWVRAELFMQTGPEGEELPSPRWIDPILVGK